MPTSRTSAASKSKNKDTSLARCKTSIKDLESVDDFRCISPIGSILIGYDENMTRDELLAKIRKNTKCLDDSGEIIDEVCLAKTAIGELTTTRKPIEATVIYKTPGPADSNKWLNNYHIFGIMNKLMAIHDDFIFEGPYTRDFAELNCRLTEKKNAICDYYAAGKKIVATIGNLDSSKTGGSHWFAIVIDMRDIKTKKPKSEAKLYFFDSVGREYPPHPSEYDKKHPKSDSNPIQDYLDDVTSQLTDCAGFKKTTYHGNKKALQKSNTECGMFSIVFIMKILQGKTFDEIINDPDMTDTKMKEMREKFFTTMSKNEYEDLGITTFE